MIGRPIRFITVLLVLILTGCITRQSSSPPATVSTAQPSTPSASSAQPPAVPPSEPAAEEPLPSETPGEAVPPPPELKTIDWDASVQPLAAQMLNAQGIVAGSVLLVDRIKNSTNGSLQTAKATAALQNALANSGKFTLITAQQFSLAKQALGLSPEDSLTSRSKAIGLARYAGAQYVLYSNAEGDVKAPVLQMQLMLVKTGEIIWSGNGKTTY